ncbi:MAG: hypothetical protein JNN20_10980 [Betaproteobacteria bacterium]|nr:hypothetical protein [Betaproteobacteria bacterium]
MDDLDNAGGNIVPPSLEQLKDKAREAADKTCVALLPVSRLVFDDPFQVGSFQFYPPGAIDLAALRPVANAQLTDVLCGSQLTPLFGQRLREVQSGSTGFDLAVLDSTPTIAFVADLNWDSFHDWSHGDDISFIKQLVSKAERALDIIRFEYCRFDRPDTLPGSAGSWRESGEWLGAMLYSVADHESYLIAGAAVESSSIVRGLGLQLSDGPRTPLPEATEGGVAAIAAHGLTLYSEVMNAGSETMKFTRAMTLLEFLANPYTYTSWKDLKGDIACHVAKSKTEYHDLTHRLRQLSSDIDAGRQMGIRTLIVHHGKLLPEVLSGAAQRADLFRELQRYAGKMLDDMTRHRSLTWAQYCSRRVALKQSLGVGTVTPV